MTQKRVRGLAREMTRLRAVTVLGSITAPGAALRLCDRSLLSLSLVAPPHSEGARLGGTWGLRIPEIL